VTVVEVHPATPDRFDDVAAVLAPALPQTPACWCLGYRVPGAEVDALRGEARPGRLRTSAQDGVAPEVVGYVDREPAGWLSVAPLDSHHRLVHSGIIPRADDLPVWRVVWSVVPTGLPPSRHTPSTPGLDGSVLRWPTSAPPRCSRRPDSSG
jgi:hypothetical protein